MVSLASDDDYDYIEIPDVIGGRDGDFVVQVGSGMNSVAILGGDYILVRPTDDLEDGALMVAVPAGADAAAVFKASRRGDQVRLRSGRKSVPADGVAEILGTVIGVLRRVSSPGKG